MEIYLSSKQAIENYNDVNRQLIASFEKSIAFCEIMLSTKLDANKRRKYKRQLVKFRASVQTLKGCYIAI